MTRGQRIGFFFTIFAIGCHPLSPGRVGAVRSVSGGPRIGQVCLIRGWRDLWSRGIDDLARQLQDAGVRAEVYRAAQWREVAESLAASRKNSSSGEPLVLIGFSYGADDAIEIARRLGAAGLPVELVITIDPVTPPPVPANVGACVNFYQTNGVWDAFPWLRGIPLKSDAPSNLINVDLRRAGPDLVEPGTSHANIAANPKLHREIIERVLATCVPSGPSHTSLPATRDRDEQR